MPTHKTWFFLLTVVVGVYCLLAPHRVWYPVSATPAWCCLAGEGPDGGEQAPHWMDTLMDVLLALLAQTSASLPSAPLREAVEHVFRVFCDQLTPTGGGQMRSCRQALQRSIQEGSASVLQFHALVLGAVDVVCSCSNARQAWFEVCTLTPCSHPASGPVAG